MNRFWSGTHPRQAEWEVKWEKLVPMEGRAETLHGEILRAAGRIHHDFYNNGFGNNWSGALNFLQRYLPEPPADLDRLRPYCRGVCFPERKYRSEGAGGMDELLECLLERALDATEPPAHPDMFDLQEPDLTTREWEELEEELEDEE